MRIIFLSLLCFSHLSANPLEWEECASEEAEEEEAPTFTIRREEASTRFGEKQSVFDAKEETPPAAPLTIPNWYFEVKPGYYYFTENSMREFFDNGGWTIRGEAGYRVYGPLAIWFDGSYFKKEGHALGGPEETSLLLATLSLGLKAVWYPVEWFAFYAGAAPRLFLLMLHNDSPYVPSNDNEIGLGGGFQGGFWVFPIPQWKNFFLDVFADFSLKTMKIEPDEISSDTYDINLSGLTFGLGVGYRF